MATEAQRLIGISLTKIAQSRAHRGGVSLHKNLLVATVLQKARYIFMEEAYNMVHYQPPAPVQARPVPQDQALVGITAEEAPSPDPTTPECTRCQQHQDKDKENHPPYELTYLDLDRPGGGVLKGRGKRRRAVAEWETEEAVQSILPKRSRSEDSSSSSSSSSSSDDEEECDSPSSPGAAMEIDRITSLVSIFSFTMGGGEGSGNKLSRSVSTPDLCSAQAKDASGDVLQQQRPFLAMTV